MSKLRYPTLAAGMGIVLLGLWILLDASGDVGMSFAALGPALAALAGLVLLISGLEDRE
jgi:hypothetical protein